jgi:hypothetical protein
VSFMYILSKRVQNTHGKMLKKQKNSIIFNIYIYTIDK